MTELAHHSTDYSVVENEAPQVMARNLRIASKLWASSAVFFFFAFLFAYFYLRSLNSQGLWHPHNVKAPVGLGTLIAACVVVSAAAAYYGARRLESGDESAWQRFGLGALVFGLAAVVLQIVEWSMLGFGPTNGGFASVFLGWTGLYCLFVLGTMYWLETLVATSFRYSGAGAAGHEPGEASGDVERTGDDIHRPLSLVAPGASAFAFYWVVLAGIGVVTWLILYLL
ncbi:MAG TPA: cytochrome c oxidase subunit 3 [Gaiellaceae bacterium]|nr:cytochrome c oxidase subunit 3 [Gaiellaceae bacterium]